MAYCSECGSAVTAQDRFCPECGEPVHSTTDADAGDETDSYDWSSTEIEAGRYASGASGASVSHDTYDDPERSGGALSFALSFPTVNGYGPVLKGGVLVFLSFLVVPLLTLLGYGRRVCRAAANGDSRQPPFEDWGALTKDGFGFLLVSLAFAVVLGVALVLASVVAETLGVVVYLAGIYLAPGVLTTYAATGSVEATYASVLDFALTGSYLKATLVYLVLSLAIGLLAGISVITVVGPFFVYAFGVMALAAYWGYVYNRATREGIVPTPSERTPGGRRTY